MLPSQTAFATHTNDQASFVIHDFRVDVGDNAAFCALPIEQQLSTTNHILAQVRKRSYHPDGIYSAALAITENGHILVASNTQNKHNIHRDCAESNLMDIISQLHGESEKITRLYLMMGFSTAQATTPITEQERPYAPCGTCTDGLTKCCTSGAEIITLPANDGSLALRLNSTARYVDELKPTEAWQTTVAYLASHRILSLTPQERERAEHAWAALLAGKLTPSVLHLEQAEQPPHNSAPDTDAGKWAQLARKAAENALTRRQSIPALDIDASPAAMNRFMVESLAEAVQTRTKAGGAADVETVRCVVVRLTDGSFHSITEVEGPHENAVPHAETSAVALTQKINGRIAEMWVMQANREEIARGELHTSAKEGLERIYKRRPKDQSTHTSPATHSVVLHYYPFNDGTLTSEEVVASERRFLLEELYASRYKGSRHHKQNGGNGFGHGLH